jgi:hypothetical protein
MNRAGRDRQVQVLGEELRNFLVGPPTSPKLANYLDVRLELRPRRFLGHLVEQSPKLLIHLSFLQFSMSLEFDSAV